MPEQCNTHPTYVDAQTFQKPLGRLAEVLAQKVRREAPKMLSAPRYVSEDLYILIRKAMCTYDLFFYENADERRQGDPYFRGVYSILLLPLVRKVIDCLYNITFFLQDPAANGAWFRKRGYKRELFNWKKTDNDIAGGLNGTNGSARKRAR
jgi:hypothetical protein